MTAGLSVSDVVNVSISLAPQAIPTRNFGALCIVGTSSVITTAERVRQYATLNEVAGDFGTTAPEYYAADLFFSQNPTPSIVYIGRWANGATSGVLNGATFSSAQQTTLLSTLQAITAGSLSIAIGGTTQTPTGLNFSGIANLNGAASVLQAGLTGATVRWDATNGRFVVTDTTTGPSSTVGFATDAGTGATLATDMGLTQSAGASAPVPGISGETPLQAVTAISSVNSDIYGIIFAEATGGAILDTDYIACAAFLEGAQPPHVFGITTQETAALDPTSTTDLAYLLAQAKYSRTFIQYSSSSPYAVCSAFGRAFTTDFTANNSMITLKFKTEPGVTAEVLTETQAATLNAKNCNVFVQYQNGAAIIQQGVMSDGTYFDVRQGSDWLQNNVQTAVFNLLYTSPTKVPQTDAGVHQIVTTVEAACAAGVYNGLIAPGQWNSSYQFGQLHTGDMLTKGYYVYAPPISTQSEGVRQTRAAPTIQVAVKLGGAVHSANVAINVNQ